MYNDFILIRDIEDFTKAFKLVNDVYNMLYPSAEKGISYKLKYYCDYNELGELIYKNFKSLVGNSQKRIVLAFANAHGTITPALFLCKNGLFCKTSYVLNRTSSYTNLIRGKGGLHYESSYTFYFDKKDIKRIFGEAYGYV